MEERPFNTPIHWDINISIFKNPLLWLHLSMVVVASSSLFLLFLLGLGLLEGDSAMIAASFLIALSIAAVMFFLLSLVLVAMFWRGVPTRYILHENYIEQHTLSRRAKLANRLGPLAASADSNAGLITAGGSLLTRSREVVAVELNAVSGIDEFSSRKEIRLKNNWRTRMQVYCPDNQFENIRQFILSKTEDGVN